MREWLSWWSTTLPRLGSRVRVPSRALKKEAVPFGIVFSIVGPNPRVRGLRSAPVRAKPRSPGPRAPSRALKKEAVPFGIVFSIVGPNPRVRGLRSAPVRAKPRFPGPRAPSRALFIFESLVFLRGFFVF